MVELIRAGAVLSLIVAVRVFFQTRADIAVEVLALRQQVAVLKRKRPRPPLRCLDRLFWTVLRRTWPRWRDALAIVKPETVVGWHRTGFRLYWQWKSRPKRWLAFLHNHREAIVAFDFFTVPTATFRVLYCFFVIEHERRKILHFNVTRHPSSDWVVQQLRETFPDAAPYRNAILDHDSIFNGDAIAFLAATGLKAKRTSIHSPGKTEQPKDGLEAVAARSSTTSSRCMKNTFVASSASTSAITIESATIKA